jgi:hypothetical protein
MEEREGRRRDERRRRKDGEREEERREGRTLREVRGGCKVEG